MIIYTTRLSIFLKKNLVQTYSISESLRLFSKIFYKNISDGKMDTENKYSPNF